MKFKIGIEIERTQSSVVIVECEAESIEEARKVAFKAAEERARNARSWRDLFKNTSLADDIGWEDGWYSAMRPTDEISQAEMPHYSADIVVPNEK